MYAGNTRFLPVLSLSYATRRMFRRGAREILDSAPRSRVRQKNRHEDASNLSRHLDAEPRSALSIAKKIGDKRVF